MSQDVQTQLHSSAIASLKAATRQVVQSPPSIVAPIGFGDSEKKLQPIRKHENFAEAFIGKVLSIENEKMEIEKKIERLQSDFTIKKKQLEHRRDELMTVKDKLMAFDKELSDVLEAPDL